MPAPAHMKSREKISVNVSQKIHKLEKFPRKCTDSPRTLTRIVSSSVTPTEFYEKFVATRTPCVISGRPVIDLEIWSNAEALAKQAGGERVLVERRAPSAGSDFGGGRQREEMTFRDFVAARDPSLYLTTQYATKNSVDDAREAALREYCQAPLPSLLKHIPHPPYLFPSLVPHQVTLWMGMTVPGAPPTSSGLHHDYHDNLYVLASGRKRFTLFPPTDAKKMYLHGEIKTIHDNGLISYTKAARSDGALLSDVRLWRTSELEEHIEAARADGDAKKVSKLEKALDMLLDQALGGSAKFFDSDGSDEDAQIPDFDDVDYNRLSDEGDFSFDDADDFDDNDILSEGDAESDAGGRVCGDEGGHAPPPPSFSRVPTSALHTPDAVGVIKESFPLISTASRYEVTLNAGDMLYLPASWFHEVSSSSGTSSNFHIALNFWFHPPSAKGNFAKPYEDEFWLRKWAPIQEEVTRRMDSSTNDSSRTEEPRAKRTRRTYYINNNVSGRWRVDE